MTDRERWGVVDSLRGVAIAGILFVNIPDLVGLGYDLAPGQSDLGSRQPLYYLVSTRFVPIFTLLFGMSLTFVLAAARRRGRRPCLALLLRLVALFGIGLLHALVYSGEVLREYAVGGLLVLPIVLFAPRLLQLVLGLAATAVAYAVAGGVLAVPGLMLTGAALAAYQAPRLLETSARPVRWVFLVATVLLVPALWWQSTTPGDPRFSTGGGVAGLVMAAWYVTGLSLLWATPVRRALRAAFDPLGRMALSNYVGASLVVAAVAQVVDFRTMPSVAPAVALAAGILLAQSLVSRLWLRSFRHGPLEWLWRCVTWRQPVPLRRRPPQPAFGQPQPDAASTLPRPGG